MRRDLNFFEKVKSNSYNDKMIQNDIFHLYARAGFGLSPEEEARLASKSRKEVIDELFKKTDAVSPIAMDLSAFDDYLKVAFKQEKNDAERKAEKQRLQKLSRKKSRELNQLWIERLVKTEQVLSEKMTLFWANIFVCRDNAIVHSLPYNNLLRAHALGDFHTFLLSIAKSPSMLKYLNNRQNVKKQPNENFARELLELFTLGIGHYTEQDIKEAARAFTGWTFRRDGSFFIRPLKHDNGTKTFLGKTGNWNGEDIIKIILQQRQCARHICKKIYTYFVNPVVNDNQLEMLTEVFYNGYDIKKTMKFLFMQDWFYAPENMGVKIKSPIELLVGIQRIVPVSFSKPKQLYFLQKVMGQILLYPPNVAGWKQDRSWIDANTLMFRLNLPAALLSNSEIEFTEKPAFEDDFDTYYKIAERKRRILQTKPHWEIFEKKFKNIPTHNLQKYVLRSSLQPETARFLSTIKLENKQDYCIQLMSLPEYQLC